jgi:hypothetical protein
VPYSEGSLVGYNEPGVTVIESYGTGALADSGAGGLIGIENDGAEYNYLHNYWDLDTTGIANPAQGVGNVPNAPGIKGLGDARLRSRLPKGFNTGAWGHSKDINNGYPYLLANPPPKGNKAKKKSNAWIRRSR